MTLVDTLSVPAKAAAVVADGAIFIDREVRSKSGLRGFALKAGYKAVRKIKPGIIDEALGALLPRFAPAIDPHYAKGRESGDVREYFVANSDTIAESLLAVTDERAKVATNRIMIKAYTSLRSQAKGHVMAAMPGLAKLISDHVA
jgi:hypothetical protein